MIEWKPVIGYENEYLISNNGEIKSLPKKTRRGERFIKPQYTHGYAYVQLCKDKIITKKRIHRLVAEAFLENPEKLPQVNHKDHIRSNNHFSNLEWVTAQQNNEHGQAKTWIGKLNGIPVEIFNIRKFCRENNLIHQYFSLLTSGKRKEYAGYTL
jgi:hypothetical protein